MITHVEIKDFRSFGVTPGSRPGSFDLKPFTVIVGDNSAGKSNIVRALLFATTPDIESVTRYDFFGDIVTHLPEIQWNVVAHAIHLGGLPGVRVEDIGRPAACVGQGELGQGDGVQDGGLDVLGPAARQRKVRRRWVGQG